MIPCFFIFVDIITLCTAINLFHLFFEDFVKVRKIACSGIYNLYEF